MNLVLTGPMGSGKTAVGKVVAKALDMRFIDTDKMITKKAGMNIDEIFSRHGQGHFRELEEIIISEVSKLDNHVIATGGGVVLRFVNMRNLRCNGIIINLKASLDTLFERLNDMRNRPLLNKPNLKEELKKHSEGRLPFYKNADFVVKTDDLGIDEVAEKIVRISKLSHPRICACIAGKNPEKQIQQAVNEGASMVELRLDLIKNPDILSLVQMSGLPVIATDRKNKDNLIRAIEAGCDLIDIEIDSPEKQRVIEKAKLNGCKVIVSMHDFMKTPKNLKIEKGDADLLKIAAKVNSVKDCQRLLDLLKERKDLIIIGMGKLGSFTRVVAPLLGSQLTYTSLGESTVPGQINLKDMLEIFRRIGLK